MSRQLCWLHLSDLHVSPRNEHDAVHVRQELLKDLRRLKQEKRLRPDLIFFTGDLAFGHLGDGPGELIDAQLAEGHQFLTAIRNLYDPPVAKNRVFLVPGNHDIDRRWVESPEMKAVDNRLDDYKQTQLSQVTNILANPRGAEWQMYARRFESYRRALIDNGYDHLAPRAHHLVYSVVIDVNGVRVGVTGLNSAWHSGRTHQRGHLWVGGQWQLDADSGANPTAAEVSIVLIHHPGGWFTEFEEPDFGQRLVNEYQFHLHGHEHEGFVYETLGHARIAAAACYDRPGGRHAYNMVSLDLDEKKGNIWLRYYDLTGKTWAPLHIPSRTDDQRTGRWELSLYYAPRPALQLVTWDYTRLPPPGGKPIGREGEIAAADRAWVAVGVRVLEVVALGGAGKSTLVYHWLAGRLNGSAEKPRWVFAWSFFRQGETSDRIVSSDDFLAAAFTFFRIPDSNLGTAWLKGKRLAEEVARVGGLLILDGLEPLLEPASAGLEGASVRCRDEGLRSLIETFVVGTSGFCVITTRYRVAHLDKYVGESVVRLDLQPLTPAAGARLLRDRGVTGDQAELEEVSRRYRGHCLSLVLLGRYISQNHGGDIRHLPELMPAGVLGRDEDALGQVMKSYEASLRDTPELAIARLLGLFDRPADIAALSELCEQGISHLTESIREIGFGDWQKAVRNLRAYGLLAEPDQTRPDWLEAHPMIRAYFADQIRTRYSTEWKQAHAVLHRYFLGVAEARPKPTTLEEMAPAYESLSHGCLANLYKEAFDVYYTHIRRKEEHFSWRRLGAVNKDLVALSGFFKPTNPPWAELVDGLKSPRLRGLVLWQVGLYLLAKGQVRAAADPMAQSIDLHTAPDDQQPPDWDRASSTARNLSEVYSILGEFEHAQNYAVKSLELSRNVSEVSARISCRAALASILYYEGKRDAAEQTFQGAEADGALLRFSGFRHAEFLLDQGRYQDVLDRIDAMRTAADADGWLLAIALYHLTHGEVLLRQALATDAWPTMEGEIAEHLEQGLGEIRHAGTQHHLPCALRLRAELFRFQGKVADAANALEEAIATARRGEMKLHLIECLLEKARLAVVSQDLAKAREQLAEARQVANEIGYRRCDQVVRELTRLLGPGK